MGKTECKEQFIWVLNSDRYKYQKNQVAHLLNETLSFHQISKITMCINLSQAQNCISSQTNTPTNFMNTCTYQSRIDSKCLSTALSCFIQSSLPCICASKIWPCIAKVWSQLETSIENERWEPFICNSQKSTGLARTGSSRRLQTWIHKENTRSFEDHITCPLE